VWYYRGARRFPYGHYASRKEFRQIALLKMWGLRIGGGATGVPKTNRSNERKWRRPLCPMLLIFARPQYFVHQSDQDWPSPCSFQPSFAPDTLNGGLLFLKNTNCPFYWGLFTRLYKARAVNFHSKHILYNAFLLLATL